MSYFSKIFGLCAVLLVATGVFALPSGNHLDGDYELDFYTSSGPCERVGFIRTFPTRLDTNFRLGGPDRFIFGEFCRDRRFPGDPETPPESCSDQVWSSTLTKDNRSFEFFTYYSRVVEGVATKQPLSRFTIQAISHDRVQVDGVHYDNQGVEKPSYRCIYQK